MDKSTDYSVYALDATEADIFEGKGLLSWNLARPTNTTITGLLKPSLSGQVVEVRMKLTNTTTTQEQFIHAIHTYERIQKTLPPSFDLNNWNEFMRHANAAVSQKPRKVNTLQKARDLAARQTHQSMSAQLLAARQQQTTSQMHAQRIAHAAAQLKKGAESEGPIPASPLPSSPPAMHTFVHPARSNSLPADHMPPLAKFDSTGSMEDSRKRKADSMEMFSPSKATNAARNKFGEVQQLFKSDKPTVMDKLQKIKATIPIAPRGVELPKQTTFERNNQELYSALKEGKPIKYCYNCGTVQTKGNWRVLTINDSKQTLCNACGVYYKNKKSMRPPNLWKSITTHSFPAHSGIPQVRTSPVTKEEKPSRAIQSSPAKRPRSYQMQSITPEKVLNEITANTPGPASPSPNNIDDLFALLQTPKKSFTNKSSPSPWRSMFTTLPGESPAKHKIDKFLEELGISGNLDINAFSLSPTTENMASFMSSPPSLGLFTSSAGEENQTPEDNKPPGTPDFVDGDSLFTPRKPTTRSDTNSAQRSLRSAGKIFGENMFGAS